VAPAVLSARREAGGELLLVALDVTDEAALGYTAAGQYTEVKVERGNGYFVLAGDLGAKRWELLVRNAGDAADALASLPIGSVVEASAPLGLGFPIDRARGKPLVIAAAGSALAVARPVLRQRIVEGDAARTWVFLGVRTPREVPLAEEIEKWCEAGAVVVLCVSRGDPKRDPHRIPKAHRRAGWVQDAFAQSLPDLPRGTLVVAAGPDTMLAAMREIAVANPGMVEVVTNV
jgi:NAD(P)H-flavin reductase